MRLALASEKAFWITMLCSDQHQQWNEVSILLCRFRAVHEEVVKLDQDFGNSFSGILTDDEGRLRGIYASYAEQEDKIEREWCVGLPAAIFAPWVRRLAQSMDCEEGMASPAVR